MVKAVIFDLDNCLSAGREVPERIYGPAFDAIRAANNGHLSEEQLEHALEDAWRLAIDDVSQRHGFSDEMHEAGMNAFSEVEMDEPMRGYGDLHLLREIRTKRFLVTTGFRRLQESKIRALDVTDLFDGIVIDAIEEPGRKGKEGIFREILKEEGLAPEEVLVVGDNPDSELAAGERLGCRTIQILRPGVKRAERAWRYIHTLGDLVKILEEG